MYLSFAFCIVAARNAAALELDTLLPADIPGYGSPQTVSVLNRVHPEYTPFEINLGGVTFSPEVDATAGYDSLPNGIASGSSTFGFNPSLLALDPQLGLGAYAGTEVSRYPQAAGQNTSGYSFALGEHALLPREAITLALSTIRTQETGFGLNPITLSAPVNVSLEDVRGSDQWRFSELTLTPEFSVTHYDFADYDDQDRTDYRQSLTAEFSPDGQLRLVTLLHATESDFALPAENANTYEALAGLADQAEGLWQVRLLAGAASRQAAAGAPLTAPVLEGSLSWMPGTLDSLSLDLERELDDPDQESAAGYTLSAMTITLAHEYLRNVVLTGSLKASHAEYFNSPLNETLFNCNLSTDWHLNRALAVNASYVFNDRQANLLRAANEHILTLGLTWTP